LTANLDLVLGSAYLWTRSNRWLPVRWASWLRMVLRLASPAAWPEVQATARHLSRAPCACGRSSSGPRWVRLLLDAPHAVGTYCAVRVLTGAGGEVRLHYT